MYNDVFYTERWKSPRDDYVLFCYLLNLIGLDSVPSCIGSSGDNIDGPVLNVYYGYGNLVRVLLQFYFDWFRLKRVHL